MKQSGVFYLQIRGTTYWFLKVYCDQETTDGGWTVGNYLRLQTSIRILIILGYSKARRF